MTPSLALLTLLALLALPIPAVSDTLVDISGVLTCNLYPRFSYIVEIWKSDRKEFTRDAHLHVAANATTPFSIVRRFPPDSSVSEIVLVVNHDCNRKRGHTTHLVDVDLGKYQKIDGTYSIAISLNVDDKGKVLEWQWPEPARITVYQ